jgi:hypothetical protein
MVVAVALTVSVSAARAEDFPERHEGKLLALRTIKKDRKRMTVQEGKEKTDFTINRRTLVYLTTARNLSLFNASDKLAQIVKDSNEYRKGLKELSESQADATLALMAADRNLTNEEKELFQRTREAVSGQKEEKSERGAEQRQLNKNRGALGILSQSQKDFAEAEEKRQERYGTLVRLKVGQDLVIYTSRTEDDTLMVLVVPPKASGLAAAPADKEASAKSALRLIEALVAEGKTDVAKYRLEKFIEKYEGTQAAKKAKKMLDSLP